MLVDSQLFDSWETLPVPNSALANQIQLFQAWHLRGHCEGACMMLSASRQDCTCMCEQSLLYAQGMTQTEA